MKVYCTSNFFGGGLVPISALAVGVCVIILTTPHTYLKVSLLKITRQTINAVNMQLHIVRLTR